jgi:hypothetical protein
MMAVEEAVEIGFGTTFRVTNEPERTDIVLDVGKGTWFRATPVITTTDGIMAINITHSGTSGVEKIAAITGTLSLEDVLAAAKEGTKIFGRAVSPEQERILRQRSKQEPKTIELTSLP